MSLSCFIVITCMAEHKSLISTCCSCTCCHSVMKKFEGVSDFLGELGLIRHRDAPVQINNSSKFYSYVPLNSHFDIHKPRA